MITMSNGTFAIADDKIAIVGDISVTRDGDELSERLYTVLRDIAAAVGAAPVILNFNCPLDFTIPMNTTQTHYRILQNPEPLPALGSLDDLAHLR